MKKLAEIHAGLVAWQKMKKADRKREGFRYFGKGRKVRMTTERQKALEERVDRILV